MGECNALIGAALRDEDTQNFFAELLQPSSKHDKRVGGGHAQSGSRALPVMCGAPAQATSLPGDHAGQRRGPRWLYRRPRSRRQLPLRFPPPVAAPVWQQVHGEDRRARPDRLRAVLRLPRGGFPGPWTDLLLGAGLQRRVIRGDAKMTLFTGSQAAEKLTPTSAARSSRGRASTGRSWGRRRRLRVRGLAGPGRARSRARSAPRSRSASSTRTGRRRVLWRRSKQRPRGATWATSPRGPCCPGPRTRCWTTSGRSKRAGRGRLGGRKLAGSEAFHAAYGGLEPTAVEVPLATMLRRPRPRARRRSSSAPSGPRAPRLGGAAGRARGLRAHDEPPHGGRGLERRQLRQRRARRDGQRHGHAGRRARTTGAPQNHRFGPCGDPRSAGIHTPDAIRLCWSSHREVIADVGPVGHDWTAPAPT